MAIVVFQHHPNETSAQLGRTLRDHGHRLRTIALYDGEPVPVDLDDVTGVVSMGGPANVDQADQYPWVEPETDYIKQAHERGLPIVGICLGAQLIAKALGGEVEAMDTPEIGWAPVKQTFFGTTDPVFAGIPWSSTQLHLHGQQVAKAPPGGTPIPLVGSQACKCQAFKVGFRTYGFQYHFEWDMDEIKHVVGNDPSVREQGHDPMQIINEAAEHYHMYRRLGDRLCERLTTVIFPVDKPAEVKAL